MNTVPKKAEKQIFDICAAAINKAMECGALPKADPLPFNVEIPADRKNGD